MVMINHATREITAKIVYYGPGLCGKTTNLEYIYKTANPEKKGKLLTVATETDRTLFFDFLPMELGNIKGFKLRTQLYTVPGQVFYDATRRIVLRGADGVVFVADSQKTMIDSNIESVENLKMNLKINNIDPETIPLVIQYNKRDLPNIMGVDELNKILNYRSVPYFEASAIKGIGVNETIRKIIELVIINLHKKDSFLKGTKPPEKEPLKTASIQPPQPQPEAEEQIEEIETKNEVEVKEVEESGLKDGQEAVETQKEEHIEISLEEEIVEEEGAKDSVMIIEESDKIEKLIKKIGLLQEKIYSALNELDEIKQELNELKSK